MYRIFLTYVSWALLMPGFLSAQTKSASKNIPRNYSFITLPMMTEAAPMPTQVAALKAALHTFMTWDRAAAESLEVKCSITKVHDLISETMSLGQIMSDRHVDFNAPVKVALKFSHITWDAEFTVTKDITIEHLWLTTDKLIDFHLLSYFEKHLETSFHDKIINAIYKAGAKNTYVLKAGEKIRISNIHSYIAEDAKTNQWMCYILRDDQHPGNYQDDLATLTLSKATTLDAKTVNVDYDIEKADAKTIEFKLYRSETPTKQYKDKAILIGDTTVTNPELLTKGLHVADKDLNISLLPEQTLAPDTRLHFIVVVATCNGQSSTTYFRKWMLGAVAHGFDRYASKTAIYPLEPDLIWKYTSQDFTLPTWESVMAKRLQDSDKYDGVISFDWMRSCAIKKPGLSEEAGKKLALQICDWIANHNSHAGDIVDIHLIGHSRGTVVVSQSLKILAEKLKSQRSAFGGSYIELTLLDPHPANNDYEQPWGNWDVGESWEEKMPNPNLDYCGMPPKAVVTKALADGYILSKNIPTNKDYRQFHLKWYEKNIWTAFALNLDAQGTTACFQDSVKDSKITIPFGIKKVDIFYQHTPAYQLCDQPNEEFIQNLWGMVSPATLSCLDVSLSINKTDLTSADIDGVGMVGHNEVPLVYEKLWVESGTLNRSARIISSSNDPN
jgi:hypothetical protein